MSPLAFCHPYSYFEYHIYVIGILSLEGMHYNDVGGDIKQNSWCRNCVEVEHLPQCPLVSSEVF